jgi:transcriptional regulator with XRE-family HTH domain
MKIRVKEVCKGKGLLMEELAEKLGITPNTLTRNINGNPTIETLERIAEALDVPIMELFEKPREGVPGATKCPYCGHDLTLRVE